MIPLPPLEKTDEDPTQDVPPHLDFDVPAPPSSPASMNPNENVAVAGRTRDCRIQQMRFVYPEKSDQVRVLRPCLEWSCRTCRVYQSHHFAGSEEESLDSESTSRPQHRNHSPDSRSPPLAEFLLLQPGEIRYLEDVEVERAQRAQRTRPRFRKRIVLKFTKPDAGNPLVGTTYHAFSSYMRANDIPLYTGSSGIRGGVQVLRFREKKEDFARLVAGWGEDISDAREQEEEEGKTDEAEEESSDGGEEEKSDEGAEGEAEIPGEHETDAPVASFERAEDQWWDGENEAGRRWRKRVW